MLAAPATTWAELDDAEENELGFAGAPADRRGARPSTRGWGCASGSRSSRASSTGSSTSRRSSRAAGSTCRSGTRRGCGRLRRRRAARGGRPVVAARGEADAGADRAAKRDETLGFRASVSWSLMAPRTSRARPHSLGRRRSSRTLPGCSPTSIAASWSRLWPHVSRARHGRPDPPGDALHRREGRLLRAATYRRLRRHWQFINELPCSRSSIISTYGVTCLRSHASTSTFLHGIVAVSPRHGRSLARARWVWAGARPEGSDGNWDLRPHRAGSLTSRRTLAHLARGPRGSELPVRQTRMVYAVNRSTAAVLDKLSRSPPHR